MSAFLCLVSELVVYFKIKESLLQEIDRKGGAIVKSITNVAKEYYEEYTAAEKAFQEAKTKAQESAKKDVEELNKNNEEMKKRNEQKTKTFNKFSNYLKEMLARGEGENVIYSSEILNIAFVVDDIPYLPSIQAGQKDTKLAGREFNLQEKIGDLWYSTNIKVIEGEMTVGSRSFGIRAYSQTVIPDKLRAFIMLSEQDITKTKEEVLTNIAITTIFAIVIGIIISILLARHVTHPVRQLIKDVEAVGKGNLTHKTIPTSSDEIGILANTFNLMTQSLKFAHESELEKQAREHELKVATEIQSCLLPSQIPQLPKYDIFSFYNPSKEVGGDYYDFIEIDNDHIGFIIADVSGKGVPGSMVMTMARSLIRMEAMRNISPAKVFVEVNKILAQDIRRGMFVTAMYCVLTISTGEIVISSAGHNPAVIFRKNLGKNELVNPKGMALGFDKGTIFDRTVKEEKCKLNTGDRVLIYTDGVSEAMSPVNEEYSEERLFKFVEEQASKSSTELVQNLVKSLEQWKGTAPQSDDITIVTFIKK